MMGLLRRIDVRKVSAIVLAPIVLAACAGSSGVTKAGDADAPIVLRFGTDDFVGRAAADQIEEFGRRVAELTDGEITVEGVFKAGGEGDGRQWDQRVAQHVIDGELDGANIPARAWDLLGVTSMNALHTPFLVTSQDSMAAVLTDEALVEEMLVGLDQLGLTGLAISPDSIRYLFTVQDPPPASAADFEDALIRSPASATTWSLFEAWGAVPDDLPDMAPAIDDGSLTAIESAFGLVDSIPRTGAIANLALFPKANVLVINQDVFTSLSEEHREALRSAAAATRDWSFETLPPVTDGARDFCSGQGSIYELPDTEVERLREASQPAIDELSADAETASMIERIRRLVEGAGDAPTLTPCDPETATVGQTVTPAFDAADLNGVYRFEVTADDMRAGGVSEDWIRRNEMITSIMTITLLDGTVAAADYLGDATGTYTVSGPDVTFRIDDWSSHWSMTPELTDDGISWTFIDSLPPWGTADAAVVDRAFWTTHPWIRIGDAE